MSRHALLISFAILACALANLTPLRPPCVPLNVVSPYQSTWSCADSLFDESPQHWTGSNISMTGLIKIDGETFRFMGSQVAGEKAAVQRSVRVMPTTTTYEFDAGGVRLHLSFVTPAIGLDTDIVAASRPITYLMFEISPIDGATHKVQLYIDTSAEGSVQSVEEEVAWSRPAKDASELAGKLEVMQIGTVAQKALGQGSDLINWGYSILATPRAAEGLHTVMQSAAASRAAFAHGSYFELRDDTSGPRKAGENTPTLSMAWDAGSALPGQSLQRHLIMAYDQVASMNFFGTIMPPLWRHHWPTAVAMLEAAEDARERDLAETGRFDDALISNLTLAGGEKYATLCSLVYRQVTGGTQAVWNPLLEDAWVFIKEISSDGDVSTVDVVYPAFPMFQYLYPEYFRRMLLPLLAYGNNETKPYGLDIPYNLPWAPHHLGHWPISDIKPGDQEQMPVEESGNMLIMLAGLYKAQGSFKYLGPYMPMLKEWANFIVASLPDPGKQLCTDDFEGPSPHNTNLAAKGIVALEAFSDMLEADGDDVDANKYRRLAFSFAANWTSTAADGDHYRIQFNLPRTWSQKYNILWQKVLGLRAFPEEVFSKESSYYQTKLETCGVPLDNRHPYTKSDWSLWSASLAETQEQFLAIVDGVFKFADTTPSRAPLSDWYDVTTCKMKGFRARPVQGGLFAKMLVPPVPATEILM